MYISEECEEFTGFLLLDFSDRLEGDCSELFRIKEIRRWRRRMASRMPRREYDGGRV